jgi:hypothetical protein
MGDPIVVSANKAVNVGQDPRPMQQEFDLAAGLKLKKKEKNPYPKDVP